MLWLEIFNCNQHWKIDVDNKRNNLFDLMRIIAAYAVMYSHYHAFVKIPEPMVFGIVSVGTLAVIVFFSISGYLITYSYLNSKDNLEYLFKRCKRIFPALFFCSIFMVYFICPVFGNGNAIKYITSKNALLTFIDYATLGWVPIDTNGFASTYMHRNSLNGSLWSLGYEFTAYILLMLILDKKNFMKLKMLISTAICIIIAYISNQLKVPADIRHFINDNFILFSSVARGSLYFIPFAVGSLLALTRDWWNLAKVKIFLVAFGIVIIFLFSKKTITDTAFFFSIPFIILPIAVSFKDRLVNGRFDISYGLYIYAYPIQQIVANELSLSFWSGLLVSIVITTSIAIASWTFIEKPAIKFKW